MFLPVGIQVGAGDGSRAGYSRIVETSARFDALGRRAEDMTTPLTRIGADLHAQISAAFATEGSTGASGPWRQLSPAYGAWKQRKRPGTPILVGLRPTHKGTREHPTRPESYEPSGRMREQLLVPLGDRSTWHVSPRRLLYTPLSNIAGFHQTGTPRMPSRPPVDPTVGFLHSIDRQFAVWLNELLEQSGL